MHRTRIAARRTSGTIRWVDIEDGLPPLGTDVLIACADGVQQGVRRHDAFRSCLRGDERVFDVTHWAAMPEHPLNEDVDCGEPPD
jgi:hypothetical protein